MRFFFLFWLILFLSPTVLLAEVNRLEKAKIIKGELRLFFKHKIDKHRVKHFTLTSPKREVLDFQNTTLSFDKVIKKGKGYSYKIAQYKPTIVRVVIESDKAFSCTPYKPIFTTKVYHIPLPKTMHHTSLYVNKIKPKKKRQKSIKKKVLSKSNMKPKILKRANRYDRIVIDAGHGGHDGGATVAGKKEKDLVLKISKLLAKRLRGQGYTVYMTRTRDKFIKLQDRTKIADIKKAAVFVSIHANSIAKHKRHKVHGIETFFLQNTRDERSQRVAARENKAVLKGTPNTLSKKVILDSVLSGPKIVQSHKLAIDVHRRMLINLRKHYKGVKDGGVRHAPFWVLVGASRPSILVEVGYISHPKERKRLLQTKYQNLIVKGIAEGIDIYLKNRKKEIDF